MDKAEYRRKYFVLKTEFLQQTWQLHQEYLESNARFKKGDFVGNVLGILKVESIQGDGPSTHSLHEGKAPTIKYFGYKYKKLKGKLVRTQSQHIDYIADYDNNSLNLINVTEVDGELFYKRNS